MNKRYRLGEIEEAVAEMEELIDIEDDIVINIVDVNGENVRVAIDAPRHVKIYRGEIYRAIKDENRNAAAAPADFDLSQALPEKN